jgi:hypothetical protein
MPGIPKNVGHLGTELDSACRKFQRHSVHAIAIARRCRTILKDMPQMPATAMAMDFGARHKEGIID